MDLQETEQLLIRASAVDSRQIEDEIVAAWQEILADVSYDKAVRGLIAHRRNHPGVYLEPGHVLQGMREERRQREETTGLHPAPPPGKRWAVDVIESLSNTTTRALTL